MRLLLVEDDIPLSDALHALLTGAGYAVDRVNDGVSADALLASEQFDLVILDLNLPGADGLSMLARFRRGTPPADIVILTGYGTVANTVEAMRKGAADVIEKPFSSLRIIVRERPVKEAKEAA